ncbi:MAG: ABC transporter permease [Spirochaetota bacterium]
MTTLRMALRNVTRQRKRSVLLGGAIAFGVLIITLVQSFTGGLVDTANLRITELLGGHVYVSGQEVSDSGRQIPVIGEQAPLEEALALVEDGIESIHYRSTARGELIFVSRVAPVTVAGVDWANEQSLRDSVELVAGDIASISDPRSVLIPEPVATDLGVAVGETVLVRLASITGQQSVGEFVVGGLLRDAGILGMESVYADKAYLNSLIGMTEDQYQQVVIGVVDTAAIGRLSATIDAHLASLGKTAVEADPEQELGPARRGGGGGDGPPMMGGMGLGANVAEADRWEGTRFTVTTINDVLEPVMTIVNVLNQVSLGLFVILLVITMVGLLNTFRMILIERTREIGTMRAVGMQRGQIRNLFLLEAMTLALGGALAGIALALIAGTVISSIPITTETPLVVFLDGGSFAFPVNAAGIAGVLVMLTIITLIAAYIPARRAARMRPADSLRTSY